MSEYLRVTEEGLLPILRISTPYKCIVIIETEVSPGRQFSRLHVDLPSVLVLQINGLDRRNELLEMASQGQGIEPS